MSEQSKVEVQALIEQFQAFHDEVTQFVEDCSVEDWQKVTNEEHWSVGVVTRHIAAGHYNVLGLVRMLVQEHTLPELSIEAIHDGNALHAKDYADCTRYEVFDLLQNAGKEIVDYLSQLHDEQLKSHAYLTITQHDVTAKGLVENLIIGVGRGHLHSMQETLKAS